MIRLHVVIAFLLVCANARSQDLPASETQDWFAKDTTGMLEEVVDTFRLNADAYHQQRRVFVAKGKSRFLLKEDTKLNDVYFVAAHDAKTRTLFANSTTRIARKGTILLEDWQQLLLENNKLYRRYSPYYAIQEAEVIPDEDDQAKIFHDFVRYDPINQAVCSAVYSRIIGQPSNADAALTAGELISSEFDNDGNIVQISRIPLQGSVWQFVYGKKMGYMPMSYTIWKQDGDARKLTSKVQTSWEKQEDVWVPSQQHLVDFYPRREHELVLEIKSILEHGLQGIQLVELAEKDWRERIRVLFDEDWQRAGVFAPNLVQQEEKKGD